MQLMNSIKAFLASTASVLILAGAGLVAAGQSASAQAVHHLSAPHPGGIPGIPVMTGIEHATNGFKVTWDGPSGYYRLFQALGLQNAQWQSVGTPSLNQEAIVSNVFGSAFFRVSGPSPRYAGSATCVECHSDTHASWMSTEHATAFTNATFVALGGQTNSSCLACHTVGYGAPTGFSSATNTLSANWLAGVQCEDCHGPAANHAANPADPTIRPRVEVAATLCGGCHNAKLIPASVAQYHPPFFEDWSLSAHHEVLPDLKEDFEGSRGPTVYIPTCGRCHSGAVREAHLENDPLPDGAEAAAIGITCATCHDPHEQQVFSNTVAGISYTKQLRNPLASFQDYHTTGDFSTNYNASINVCAQCHNDRGAAWTDSSRPPHHSPQYNMLLGTVGVLPVGVTGGPATHAGASFVEDSMGKMYLVTNQCVTCHMQQNETVAATGHKFVVDRYDACAGCHGSAGNAQGLKTLVRGLITSEIQQVKGLLDNWATNQAPTEIQSYGTLAWEYDNAGELSNPDGDPTIRGPRSNSNPAMDEQKYIPDNIKKARFDLYIVLHDGSYGVHNGPYAFTLLNAARDWVQAELNQ